MLKYIKEYRFYITLFLFLLIPVIAIDTTSRQPRDYRFYDKAIVALTYPIQVSLNWAIEGAVGFFQNYLFLWNTRQENRSLLEENRKLLGTIVSLKETERENDRLRKLLSFREQHQLTTLVARVIARDVSSEFRAIRIDRGEDSGIKRDMAVLTSEGVVGRVLRTTAHTSDVVVLTDLLSAMDAVVERSRARGIVAGMTDELCQLKFALRTDDIQTGDLLVTSGLGGILPRGVSVGVVTSVERKPYGITQMIQVRPSVDFSKLDEVLIVTKMDQSYVQVAEAESEPDRLPAAAAKTGGR